MYLGEGDFEHEFHCITITGPSTFHPCPHPNSFHSLLPKCPRNAGAASKMLWNAATQCLTNNITQASVRTHRLLSLRGFRQHGGKLAASSPSLLILSNYMWHSLSSTQWRRPSLWRRMGEEWLGNTSCHKQHFLLKQRIWARSPIWIDLQGLKGHFMPKQAPSDWQKTKNISIFTLSALKAQICRIAFHVPVNLILTHFPSTPPSAFSLKRSWLLTSAFYSLFAPQVYAPSPEGMQTQV